jgi:hypothetical protein
MSRFRRFFLSKGHSKMAVFVVWDSETGQELVSFNMPAWSVAFSSDGQRIFTASPYGSLAVHDATPLPEKP